MIIEHIETFEMLYFFAFVLYSMSYRINSNDYSKVPNNFFV